MSILLSLLYFLRIITLDIEFLVNNIFFFSLFSRFFPLNMPSHVGLHGSSRKLVVKLTEDFFLHFYMLNLFFIATWKILFELSTVWLHCICLDLLQLSYLTFIWSSCICRLILILISGKFWPLCLQIFSASFSHSSPCATSILCILVILILSHRSRKLIHFLHYFSFCPLY